MSERSVVNLIMHKDVFENTKEHFERNNNEKVLKFLRDADEIIEKNDFISLLWNDIRWIPSCFQEEDDLIKYLNELNKKYEEETIYSQDEIVKRYGYECLILSQHGESDFFDYTGNNVEGDDIGMPELSNPSYIFNELKDSRKKYIVNKISHLNKNEFPTIKNYLLTKNIDFAKRKRDELIAEAKKQIKNYSIETKEEYVVIYNIDQFIKIDIKSIY